MAQGGVGKSSRLSSGSKRCAMTACEVFRLTPFVPLVSVNSRVAIKEEIVIQPEIIISERLIDGS